jgi:DNA-binding response OmpR family regulator
MGERAGLRGRRILVVEDDYLVGQAVVDILTEAGAEVLGPIGWLEEGIKFVAGESMKIDGAVLDLNLHGKKSYPIADALAACNIPFIFATGYSVDAIDGPYQGRPQCQKPFDAETLIRTVARLGL